MPSGVKPARATAREPAREPTREIDRLRRLILGREQDELRGVTARLDDPERRAGEIARVLPEALAQSAQSDRTGSRLGAALAPTVQELVDEAFQRDREGLVNSLYPIMGPAIRKAIAEAIRRMLQGLNQALEKSVSVQGVLWRIEAARTGRPFAEIVLLHNLIYRVEQVFLIHRESGVLLLHGVGASEVVQDADMVSAMLTAIQDFIRDSFQSSGDDTLDTIQMGDVTLYIEQGPALVLAAVVRGSAPASLRDVFQSVLERIHLEQASAIAKFSGDTDPFEPSRPLLESCLEARFKKKRTSPVLWIVAALLLAGAGMWGYRAVLDHVHWRRYLDALSAQPGIVVASAESGFRTRRVVGFRDPLAADPRALLADHGLPADAVDAAWEPYFALDPVLVLERAQHHLQPPAGVQLRLDGGVLRIEGTAPGAWCARLTGRTITLPGVLELDATRLVNSDQLQFRRLKQEVEGLRFSFEKGQSVLSASERARLLDAAERIDALLALAPRIGRTVVIHISGYADPSGTSEQNLNISRERADHVRTILAGHGIPPSIMTVRGKGAAAAADDGGHHRRVEIEIDDRPGIGGRAHGIGKAEGTDGD